MTKQEFQIERIRAYLGQRAVSARRHLLAEIERLQAHGENVPGAAVIMADLRAEFRATPGAHYRQGNPTLYFYRPIEPLLVDRTSEQANAGQVSRDSLASIWEWISEVALRTLAREYDDEMKVLIAANNRHEAEKVAQTFQTKVAKSLDISLASAANVERVRADFPILFREVYGKPLVYLDNAAGRLEVAGRVVDLRGTADAHHELDDYDPAAGPLGAPVRLFDPVVLQLFPERRALQPEPAGGRRALPLDMGHRHLQHRRFHQAATVASRRVRPRSRRFIRASTPIASPLRLSAAASLTSGFSAANDRPPSCEK